MSATPWLVIGWLCVLVGAAALVGAWLIRTGRWRDGRPALTLPDSPDPYPSRVTINAASNPL